MRNPDEFSKGVHRRYCARISAGCVGFCISGFAGVVLMPTKLTWKEEKRFAKHILGRIQISGKKLKIFPKVAEISGRKFIDLDDYKGEF